MKFIITKTPESFRVKTPALKVFFYDYHGQQIHAQIERYDEEINVWRYKIRHRLLFYKLDVRKITVARYSLRWATGLVELYSRPINRNLIISELKESPYLTMSGDYTDQHGKHIWSLTCYDSYNDGSAKFEVFE